jgi:hypothetical protein
MTDHVLEQLRAADPATGLDGDPHGPTGRRLRMQARSRGERPVAIDRPSRRGRIAIVVAGLLLSTGAGAFATGVFDADPADVDLILENAEDEGRFEVHLEGWRPELTTEVVICAYQDGPGAVTSASEFPLHEPLTRQALLDQCVSGNDSVRSGEAVAPTETTLCGGSITAEGVEQRLGSLNARLIAGSLRDARYQVPVVLGWHADCSEVELDGHPDRTLHPMVSLDEINIARAEEVGLKAAALRSCLDHDDATRLATAAHDRLGDAWLLIDESATDAVCHEVWVEAEPSWITIVGLS